MQVQYTHMQVFEKYCGVILFNIFLVCAGQRLCVKCIDIKPQEPSRMYNKKQESCQTLQNLPVGKASSISLTCEKFFSHL